MNPPESSDDDEVEGNFTCFIPYNLVTQHSIPGNIEQLIKWK